MNDSIKEGLEGLSKMDGVSNFLYALMYWCYICIVICDIHFCIYLCACTE